MHPGRYNLDLAQCMLQELEAYLLSKELFWPLGCKSTRNDPPYPRLTLGNLALLLVELDSQEEGSLPAQRPQLRALHRTYEKTLDQWRVATETKAAREIGARIRLWNTYLEDFFREGIRAGSYPYEVRNRVMLEHLYPLAPQDDQIRQYRHQVAALDGKLLDRFQPGNFIWDAALQNYYPQGQYPFLYGQPRIPRAQ